MIEQIELFSKNYIISVNFCHSAKPVLQLWQNKKYMFVDGDYTTVTVYEVGEGNLCAGSLFVHDEHISVDEAVSECVTYITAQHDRAARTVTFGGDSSVYGNGPYVFKGVAENIKRFNHLAKHDFRTYETWDKYFGVMFDGTEISAVVMPWWLSTDSPRWTRGEEIIGKDQQKYFRWYRQ